MTAIYETAAVILLCLGVVLVARWGMDRYEEYRRDQELDEYMRKYRDEEGDEDAD